MAGKTNFASPDRADQKSILADQELIERERNIIEILNSLPHVILILNPQRQVVFANQTYLDSIKADGVADKLGLRPGELLGCIHSLEESSGCGTSLSCKYCGAVQAILESQKTGKKITKETRLTSGSEGDHKSFDIQITAAPIIISDKKFSLVTMVDISHEKRKDVLERIFFHDLLNKAGSLNFFFESLKGHSVGDKAGSLLELASNLSNEIVEEINTHRSILEAENGELEVSKTRILSKIVIENVVKQISFHIVSYEKIINIHPDTENLPVYTDYYLIIRVIMNMLKNALEATSRGGKVIISCNKKDESVSFWVQNSRVLEDEVARQIFQRSFSTKGKDRGLGTYSMKLLGENYLGGKISFETSNEQGTIFYFDLPISK